MNKRQLVKTAKINILIEPDLRDEFQKIVESKDSNQSIIIRKFIKEYVEKNR